MSIVNNEYTKLFSALTSYGGRVPIKTNVLKGGGYKAIGSSNLYGSDFESNKSLTTGNATTDKNLSTYYSKMTEIKSYEMTDISEMITSLFRDYVVNFMNKSGDIVTITDDEGKINSQKTERVNRCLIDDLKIRDVIREHLPEITYYGGYHFLLSEYKDDTGHTRLKKRDLYDPVVVVSKTKDYKDTTYICRGDDGNIYEVPYNEMIKISINSMRLRNDLDKDKFNSSSSNPNKKESNRDKIETDTFYSASVPIYYSITHKVKEYLLKDIIISLLSIKDLVQPILLMIHMDKGTSLEAANDLTKKAEALINNYTDLSAIMSSQFGISDIIDALLNNVRVLPDYNSSMTNMGTVELNKVSQQIDKIRMELDTCKESVLSTMGISMDLAQGRLGKWEVLKMSERLNSKINSIISGIKSSIVQSVDVISRRLYKEEINPKNISVHLFNRTTIEYNNLINTSESISTLVQQISTVLEMALRTIEMAGPLFNQEEYLSYVSTTLKSIDPSFDKIVTKESIKDYIEFLRSKMELPIEDQGY